MREQHSRAAGMSPAEARHDARRRFGNTTRTRERMFEIDLITLPEKLMRDLRLAARRLRRSPGFAITAVLTLALGIGAATAIFSIVDGVLLKPLAYHDSGQLVVLWERVHSLEKLFPYVGPNPKHVQLWEQQNTAFSGISIFGFGVDGISRSEDHPRPLGHLTAQPNLLDVLQIQPILGRNFLPEESQPGRTHVALISWDLWQSDFHASPAAIGQTLRIEGVPCQIIGVLPKDFYFPKSDELIFGMLHRGTVDLPSISVITPEPAQFDASWSYDYGNNLVIGRLKPGVTSAQATAQLNTLENTILTQYVAKENSDPTALGDLTTYVQPLKDAIVNHSARSLWLLLAAVLSVLLIACINLANAQIARSIARDRESAVRSALGANAWSLLQTSLAEALLLAFAGSTLGIALAWVVVHRVSAYIHLAVARTEHLSINLSVLALSLVLTLGVTLLFGLLPALRQLRIRPQQALQNSTRTAGTRRGNLLRRWLIGMQIFACTALLLVSGLFVKSLTRLLTLDTGFNPAHILVASIENEDLSQTPAQISAFRDAILERLRAIPGVDSAAMTNVMLFNGESNIEAAMGPHSPPGVLTHYRWISPGYFATMQQSILHGREFNDHDREAATIILAQKTAQILFPNEDPIGRQVRHNDKNYTVVGVVADTHSTSLRSAPVNTVYLPHWDRPRPYGFFLLRSTQAPPILAPAIRNAIWSYNPALTITRISSLDDQIGTSLSPERLETIILSAFGVSALLLALLGIYGTLSYSVATRRQEIGIRMALGATRGTIYSTTLREIIAPLVVGLLFGWLASLAIGRVIAALLYDTAPADPIVALTAVMLFLIASAAATILPCRRAATIDPMEALRAE